jgi:hypothetical protein
MAGRGEGRNKERAEREEKRARMYAFRGKKE